MTGADLAALRLAAGLSQAELARRCSIGRNAVSYWEAKPTVNLQRWAPLRMAKALGLPTMPNQYARAGGWSVTPRPNLGEWAEAKLATDLAALAEREAARAARRRVRCKAQTRKEKPCRNMSEPGKRRCKFHGGRSTGPKTAEGRERIAEAQRKRWARWRAELAACRLPMRH